MRIREIYVEAKRSTKFNTFTVGRHIVIEEGDDHKEIETQQQHEVNNRAKSMFPDVK